MIFPIATLGVNYGTIGVFSPAAFFATTLFQPVEVDGVYIIKEYGDIDHRDFLDNPIYNFVSAMELMFNITPTQITEDEFYTLVSKAREQGTTE